jgi:prepilin-type N-terminal cleavage/methylation domain-containing protein
LTGIESKNDKMRKVPLKSQLSTISLQRERASAFTLLELLIVVGIVAVLMALITPAFTSIKGGGDVTNAAYTIKGVVDTARTYAKANNTYTWVGFYEEDVSGSSTSPATSGVGRLVMSIVASKDGTMLYTGNLTSPVILDGSPNQTALSQIGKLVKIDNLHLTTFSAPTQTPPPLDTFDTRPAATSTAAQIGDTTPPNPALTFHYPVGTSPGQYAFTKVIQFSPRGETVVTNNSYTFAPFSEIGVEPTHGAAVPVSTPANVVAVQLNGFAGDVKIYRR